MIYPIFRHTEISTSSGYWLALAGRLNAGSVGSCFLGGATSSWCGTTAPMWRQGGKNQARLGNSGRFGGRHGTPIAGWRLDDVGWFMEPKKYGSDWRSRNSNLAWAFVPF